METGVDKLVELAKSGDLQVPSEPWERLYESAQGAWPLLKQQVPQELLKELTDDNLWVLAVVLAAWAGASLVGGPVAWVVNAGLSAAGLYALGRDVVAVSGSFWDWGKTAYQAKTTREMREASAHFAQAMAKGGAALVSTVLSAAAFRAARSLVLRSLPTPKRPKKAPETPKKSPEVPPPKPPEAPKKPPEVPPKPPEAPKKPPEVPKKPPDLRGPGAGFVAESAPSLWPAAGLAGFLLVGVAVVVIRKTRRRL